MQACCTDKALNCVLRRRVEQCCRWNGLTFSSPSVGFINVCVNYPRIYAARYEVFKQSVRKLLRRDGNGVANATASALVWQLFVCGLHHFHTCAVQASAALCCSANFFRRRGRLLLSYGRFTFWLRSLRFLHDLRGRIFAVSCGSLCGRKSGKVVDL